MAIAECTSCGVSFTGVGVFDEHQDWDRDTNVITCSSPGSIGLSQNEHGHWGNIGMGLGIKPKTERDLIRECKECGGEFERPRRRGRPPTKCPTCR